MSYCSTWLWSLLCYIKKFVIEEFVIRVFHCTYSTYSAYNTYSTYSAYSTYSTYVQCIQYTQCIQCIQYIQYNTVHTIHTVHTVHTYSTYSTFSQQNSLSTFSLGTDSPVVLSEERDTLEHSRVMVPFTLSEGTRFCRGNTFILGESQQ